jgi:cysteine desulfurase
VPPEIVYLDYNATTPVLDAAIEAMLPILREGWGNPSSGHAFGRRAREAIERARAEVATCIGASPDEIVFTSGGTEASNLAIVGACEARTERRHVVTSAIEHPATLEPLAALEQRGFRVTRAPVDERGRVRQDEAPITDETALVTVMHSNNEVGTLQPIAELARTARASGALVHTDAAQSIGKVPVDVDALGVDLLSIAGHKLYAPKGVGALYVRRGVRLVPLLRGAGQERGVRPGTEAAHQIAALGVACRVAKDTLDATRVHLAAMADALLVALAARVPGIVHNGADDPALRLPNTVNVSFPGVVGAALLAEARAVAASTGSACHSGNETPSPVLVAMGIDRARALGAVRLTVGRATTAEEVTRAADELARAYSKLR